MKRVNKDSLIIGAILLIALLIRLWGINFGLPNIYHPDEPRYVLRALSLFKTFNLDPKTLPYISSSSFVYVINAIAYVPYYWIIKLLGLVNSPMDIIAPKMITMGVGFTTMPSVFLLGRILTALFGTGNVLLTYLIGRRLLKNPGIGFLAAIMVALSPTLVTNSRYITPDTFLVFFILVIFLGAVNVWQNDNIWFYIFSGIALGCLVSTKISGIFYSSTFPRSSFLSHKV